MLESIYNSVHKILIVKIHEACPTTRDKVVHNGESPNFKGLLFDKKTAQILQSLS